MKRISSLFDGCVVVANDIQRDSRGYFVKAFQEGEFVEERFNLDKVDEVFWTESERGVARGLHLQIPPMAVSKYVMCTSGRILDLILDLRADSATYGQLETIELGPKDELSQAIYIPRGFAHGFITLSEVATVAYLQQGKFSPKHDTGVLIDSVMHLIPMAGEKSLRILSERDKSLPALSNFPQYTHSEWQA